jgi:hypothetical protein
MAPVERISLIQLINCVAGLPEEIRNDFSARAYFLALAVAKHFFGEPWVLEHLRPDPEARGFLQIKEGLPPNKTAVQQFRVIDLGEMLFNLQHIYGFDGCVERMKNGSIEPTLAELDAAKMLFINDQRFWFVTPSGQIGNDFDFIVLFPDARLAPLETKCNLETEDVNFSTIKNALDHARKQLPKDEPGIIFVKLPMKWLSDPTFEAKSIDVGRRFLAGTGRVASVVFYISMFYYANGILSQGIRFKEIPNPKPRFGGADWQLLNNWVPPDQNKNLMPRNWVRFLYFPGSPP